MFEGRETSLAMVPRLSPLQIGGSSGESVDEVVHGVARVTLHPREVDPASRVEHELEERLPQVAVGHGLALRVLPPPPTPADVPAIVEALHDVGRIAHHLERAVQRGDRLQIGNTVMELR